jgi:hypothetical protein
MRGSADVVLPLPHPRATAQRRKPLIALIVIGISLGTGFAASQVWPLPKSSASPPSQQTTAVPEPKEPPSAQPRLPTSSPPPSLEFVATPTASQAAGAGQSKGSSETPSYSAPVEPVALETPPKRNNRTVEDEASAPAGPRLVRSPHVSRARHAHRTPVAGATSPEFAPNPRPNQPSRDFMAHRSGN